MKFTANEVRLQVHALACNLANFLRTIATPEVIETWSLTSLHEWLIKTDAPRAPWSLRHLPNDRRRAATKGIPGRAQPDQRSAQTATHSSSGMAAFRPEWAKHRFGEPMDVPEGLPRSTRTASRAYGNAHTGVPQRQSTLEFAAKSKLLSEPNTKWEVHD